MIPPLTAKIQKRSAAPISPAKLLLPTTILLLLAFTPARAQDTPTLVLLHAESAKPNGAPPSGPALQTDVSSLKIGGKPAPITAWTPLLKGNVPVQLAVLLDASEQIGVPPQFDDLKAFFNALPANIEIGVGYMLQGRVNMDQPFTSDRALAGAALHPQPDAAKNDNGSPYSCLKDLAKHWPTPDPSKLRIVLMITDGIDRFGSQGGDGIDPNVDAAALAAVRAGFPVFSIYYVDPHPPQGRSEGGALEGQSLLDELAKGTNGRALYLGQGAPNSFDPFLQRFYALLSNEYVATVTAKGSGVKTLDVKTERKDIRLAGPNSVMIGNLLK